jgi:hypothetical protein
MQFHSSILCLARSNIEFSGGAESEAKLPVPTIGYASNRRYVRRPLQRFVMSRFLSASCQVQILRLMHFA